MQKRCSTCKNNKEILFFGKDCTSKDGLRSYCKECQKEKNKIRYYSEDGQKQQKRYYIDNKAIMLQKNKINRDNKRKELALYKRNKRKEDNNYKLSCILRSRVSKIIKNNKKPGSFVQDLGCSIGELKQYIENKFQPGMNWDNWSMYGWHLDHIIPLASFDLTDREQFLKAAHYTNLQPLWAKDNLSKGDKII